MSIKHVVACAAAFVCIPTLGSAALMLSWDLAGEGLGASDVANYQYDGPVGEARDSIIDVNPWVRPVADATPVSLTAGLTFDDGAGNNGSGPAGAPVQIPEPLSLTLLGAGLIGAAMWTKRMWAPRP